MVSDMNRIQPSVRSPQVGPVDPHWDLSLAQCSTGGREVAHSLFAPQHYEPNYAYPLIVWLHGPKDDERQLVRIMPIVSMRNYVAVAPRGVVSNPSSDTNSAWLVSEGVASQTEQNVFDSIAIAREKFHIAPRRIFVAGHDTGGTMAYHLALSHPEYFAGALSFAGALPTGQKPFRHLEQARRLAVFMAVGRDSTAYSPEKACDDLRLLHSAGLSITFRQYPCGQELCMPMLQDMDRWIIEQITRPLDDA